MTYIAGIIPTTGWRCAYCGHAVELVRPGAWWRHVRDVDDCEYRLMDDAYHADTDRYYQREEDDE